MSNTRRLPPPPSGPPMGPLPRARKTPPSADVAEHNLAQVIGQAVAYHLGELLGPLLKRIGEQQGQPACIVCAAAAKRAERDYGIAAANAKAAAEDEPAKPDTRVSESFTDGARGPVCWSHYDPELDGPYDLADMLPPSVD